MEEFMWFYFLVVYVLRWPMQLTGFKIPRTNQLYNLFKITILPAFLASSFFFPSKPVFWRPSWTVQPCTELPCSNWCWEDQASNASFPFPWCVAVAQGGLVGGCPSAEVGALVRWHHRLWVKTKRTAVIPSPVEICWEPSMAFGEACDTVMLDGCLSSWHWSSGAGRCIGGLLSSMLCSGMRCRHPLVRTSWAGLLFEGCSQCSERVPGEWQTRKPPGGSDPSRLCSWPHCPGTPHQSKPSLPSFLLYGGQPPYSVSVLGPARVTTVRTAVKLFQAVVHWAKVRGSCVVFCCLPALSAAGSWLVYSPVSAVDDSQGLGLRSSWNSMNWFAQIFSFTLIGICALMGVKTLTKNDSVSTLLLPVRRAAAASRTCTVTLLDEWYWSGTCPRIWPETAVPKTTSYCWEGMRPPSI